MDGMGSGVKADELEVSCWAFFNLGRFLIHRLFP